MKSRILIASIAVMMLMGIQAKAQDCATCSNEANTCATCAPCQPCELFGGLKCLLACRPCAVCGPCEAAPAAAAPSACAPSACAPAAAAPSACAPATAAAAPTCGTCNTCDVCAPCAPCCGPVFPCLKPALCNTGAAIACVGVGVTRGARCAVSSVFGTLAEITAPCCTTCCDTCATCGQPAGTCGCSAEAAPGYGCTISTDAANPAPAGQAAPLPETPAVAE